MTIYIEIYLTTIVIGAIFFTILTSIMSGMSQSGSTSGTIVIQFFLIFFFMPLISALFILLIKTATPTEE